MADYLAETRRSYDTSAADYATWIEGELPTKPLDRALLNAFAELTTGEVADVGCGTGRITSYLHKRGVEAFGVDLSPELVKIARQTHPHLRFEVGSMTALEIEDGSLGGIVAWYSTIHVPDADLPGVFEDFHRALAPGAHLQLAFQVGDEIEHRTKAGTHEVSLNFHYRQPEQLADLLEATGLTIRATTERAPDKTGDYPEDTPQGYVLAQKPQPR